VEAARSRSGGGFFLVVRHLHRGGEVDLRGGRGRRHAPRPGPAPDLTEARWTI
jgi:hypothetical protein